MNILTRFVEPLDILLTTILSYYFPPKTLFRTFFCSIAAALTLKFLNPYGTGNIVMFEVRYATDWRFFEMIVFILLGGLGGALGALFIKASKFWAQTFRRIPLIKRWPVFEVILVALITGLVSFWNRYTKLAVTELLFELASPCAPGGSSGLCPKDKEQIVDILRYLCIAFVIKSMLTTITFGIKVPAGIYVPSMVVGGLLGRIVGHSVQFVVLAYPSAAIFDGCPMDEGVESCVTPGVYALVAAGATMCGVTRLSVTLAVILLELTGSLDHVLPFSLSVLVAKWTADAIEPLSIYVSGGSFESVFQSRLPTNVCIGFAHGYEFLSFPRQQTSSEFHDRLGGNNSTSAPRAYDRHIEFATCMGPDSATKG